jgi:hypothetical protein
LLPLLTPNCGSNSVDGDEDGDDDSGDDDVGGSVVSVVDIGRDEDDDDEDDDDYELCDPS